MAAAISGSVSDLTSTSPSSRYSSPLSDLTWVARAPLSKGSCTLTCPWPSARGAGLWVDLWEPVGRWPLTLLSVVNQLLTSFLVTPRVVAILSMVTGGGLPLILAELYQCTSWLYSRRVGNGGAIPQLIDLWDWN